MTNVNSITVAAFAPHMDALEALRSSVSQATDWPVFLEFGDTDGVQPWASLCVQELPWGSSGAPGVLVSVLRGEGVPGHAVVVPASCRGTLCYVEEPAQMAQGLEVACSAAINQFSAMM
jgi:hypothetical protein